jgi:signal transduction histidine kinase
LEIQGQQTQIDLTVKLWQKPRWLEQQDWRLASVILGLFVALVFYYILIVTDSVPFIFPFKFEQGANKGWFIGEDAYSYEFGVQKTDRIIAADNVVPTSRAQLQNARTLVLSREGQITYTISRDDFSNHPRIGRASLFLYGFLSLSFLSISISIYLWANQPLFARLLFGSFGSLGLAFYTSGLGTHGQIVLNGIQVTFALLSVYFLLYFFAVFPKNVKTPLSAICQKWRCLKIFHIVSLLIIGVTFINRTSGVDLGILNVVDLESLYLVLCGIVALVLALLKLIYSRYNNAINEMSVIVLSTVLGLAPYLSAFTLELFEIDISLVSQWLIAFFVIVPLGYAYAMLQFQSFGVRRYMRRRLVYLLAAAIVFLTYLTVFYALTLIQRGSRELSRVGVLETQLIVVAIVSVLIAFSFGWLLTRLRNWLDRFIFRDYYDYRPALQSLTLKLAPKQQTEEIAKTVMAELAQLFKPEFLALSIYQNEAGQASRLLYRKVLRQSETAFQSQPPYLEPAVALRLPVYNRLHMIGYEQVEEKMVIVEFDINSYLSGVIVSGQKASTQRFDINDAMFLETIGGVVQTKLQNALLIEELTEKVQQLQLTTEQLRYSKDQLIQADEKLIKVAQEERSWLAREIHDEPLQRLMLVLRQFDSRDNTITEREKFTWNTIEEVCTTLRNICLRLRPTVLEQFGLEIALQALVERTREEAGIPIQLMLDTADLEISEEAEIVIYRTCQEALHNIVKHSGANQARVEISETDGQLVLRICDNGRGFDANFDAAKLLREGHLGLVGTRERLIAIGGQFNITSRPGHGTSIEAIIELDC